MRFQFTHALYLLLLLPAAAWVIWLWARTDAQLTPVRRWLSLGLRCMVLLALILAIAGAQALLPVDGMNVFYLLDRSDSVPGSGQEAARDYVNRSAHTKRSTDRAGAVVFGSEASIEFLPNTIVDLPKVQAVVGSERTDLAEAIRLGTAALPEAGQKRLVVLSDGNQNSGDALEAVAAARRLGATVDVVPLGSARRGDVSLQRLEMPARLKRGQPFELKIVTQAEEAREATLRLWRNDQLLGEQKMQLNPGKNLHSLSQRLEEPGFYNYEVLLEIPGDPIPQNNRAAGFAVVAGEPKLLIVSDDPAADRSLASALQNAQLQSSMVGLNGFPTSLAELQTYDTVFISNLSAGDLGMTRQRLLESAVRDFGVGLVCVGGPQTYAAGGYRGTPLESALPLSMELDSKKVLPPGAVVLIMHGMEFMNGNQVARDCAQGVLSALGPGDEMGVLLWDGNERWLFPLAKVGDRKEMARQIAGMNQGDLASFQGVLQMAHEALAKSRASLKHIIIFSDGDPQAPKPELMQAIVKDRITVSSILIAGHVGPETMILMADAGRGRFYNITSPDELPQVFIKETAVILKSAIYEEPFVPQVRSMTEPVRGIQPAEYPQLLGYVATTPKPRAETPLWTPAGDPLLAHWQYGLGRAVAFTSDAQARWGKHWTSWGKYRQFWTQLAQWSLRRAESADFDARMSIENGEGLVSLDAVDAQGNYRNFLNLQASLVDPKGDRQTLRLEQNGPGHYEARFKTRVSGVYMANVLELAEGGVRAAQVLGATVSYSPEFNTASPDLGLLGRIAERGGGKLLDLNNPIAGPFSHDRIRTFQPRDLWEWLLQFAVLLFVVDIAVRRVMIDREEWAVGWRRVRAWIPFLKPAKQVTSSDPSLSSLLARRHQVRAQQPVAPPSGAPEHLFQPREEPSAPAPDPASASSVPPAQQAQAPSAPAAQGSTASRLLEAKRRAQKKQE